MKTSRKIASTAAVLGMAGAGLIIGAPAASAATAYNGACGSGYSVIDSMKVGGTGTEGVSYLTYNSSNGYNCVVTMTNTPGKTSHIDASLEVSGGSWHTDEGQYSTYAGPVYVYAKGHCIDWGGYVSYSGGVVDLQWNDHCG